MATSFSGGRSRSGVPGENHRPWAKQNNDWNKRQNDKHWSTKNTTQTTKDCATYSEVNNFHIFIEHASCHNQDVAGLMKHCDDRDSLQGQ
jgi:hypothetical protein